MDITAINPNALPSLPLNERAALPDVAAIYFALAADNSVLYIGKTSRLVVRLKTHYRRHQFASIPRIRIAWLDLTDSIDMLDEIETVCIEYFTPPLNWTAQPENAYPFVRWRQDLKSTTFSEDSKLNIQFDSTLTAELAEGISFQPLSYELWQAE